MKFLEEEVQIESLNNAATTNEQDGEDEDLVCSKIFSIIFIFLFILVRSYLIQKLRTNTHKQHNCII
jgi:flagellar biogenesis protein FliO